MGTSVADGEAVQAVVRFGPPAIEDGKIQSAIEDDLLAAGAGSLKWTARIVQPYVHALHEQAAYIDVVVFDEDEFVGELLIAHERGDLLQDALAGFVVGMRLAGKDKLHGTLGVIDHQGKFFDVPQN